MAIRFKRVGKWLGATLALLLLLVIAGVSATLSSEGGRLWLSERALALLEGTGTVITLEQLQSPSLGEWRFSSLTVKRGQNTIAQAQQVKLSWRPGALLKRQLWVNELSAEQVRIGELPESNDTQKEDKQPFELTLPSSPVSIRLSKMNLQRLELPGNLGGNIPKSWQMSASGNMFVKDKPPTLTATVQTIDTPQKLLIRVNSSIKSDKQVVLSGELQEEKGGWLQSIAQIPPQALALEFSFSARQGVERWEVNLTKLKTELLNTPLSAKASIIINTVLPAINVEQLDLWVDEQQQQASAYIESDKLEFDATLDELRLSIIENWAPMIEGGSVSGKLNGTWTPKEPERWPELTANLELNTELYQKPFDLKAELAIKQQLIQLASAKVGFGDNQVSAQGLIDIFGDQNNLDIAIQQLDASVIDTLEIERPEAIETLHARVMNTKLKVQGAFKQPKINVKGSVDGQYQKQRFSLALTANADEKHADIDTLKLKAGEGSVHANGRLDWITKGNNLNLEFINLREPLLELTPTGNPLPGLTFKLDGTAHLQGALLKPKLTTDLSISGRLPASDEQIPFNAESKGEVFLGNLNETRINLSRLNVALFDKNIIEAQGVYTRDNLDFKLDIDRLPQQTLEVFGITQLKGDATAKLRLRGTFNEPQLDGHVHYSEQNDVGNTPGKNQDLKLEFKTIEGTLHTDAYYQLNRERIGELYISLPLAKYLTYTNSDSPEKGAFNFPLEAVVKGSLALSASEQFLNPELHKLAGSLNVDLQVSGTLGYPNLLGELTLERGRYTNEASEVTWDNIQAKLVAKGEVLHVETLRLQNGGSGYIDLTGRVNWAAAQRYQPDAVELSMEAKNARLIDRRNLLAEVGGKLDLNGSFKELTLEGVLNLAPLHASIDSAISSSIPSIEVHEVSDEASTSSIELPVVNLDLRILAEQQAYIRGRGLEAELEGEVNVKGTASEPLVDGRFGTVRGKMDLFGKRFVLQQGEILFSNDSATLRIPATHEGEDVTTKLEIYGSARAPKIQLESVPPLPEDEILSRLIFGKSASSITTFEAIRLAGAINTLRSEGGFDPLDAARHKLGVDTINIESQEGDEGSGVKVGVGKYINDKVYLQLEKTPNPSQPWQATIEVELTPRIHLESGTNNKGGAGAELIWKKDY